jgi:2-keto-3-deoxy-L-rhamnonate aldolase RhmA
MSPTFPPSALTRLRARKPVFGIIQIIPGTTLTELAVWSGYNFVILDCQYGVVDEKAQLASLQLISGSEAFSVVRVRCGDLDAVGRYLDFGADAILFPDVQTPADALALVAAGTHGPVGTRSSTGTGARAGRHGLAPLASSRDRPLLLAMIEGASAIDHIAAIASTPGLGGIVIGPNDLSADLGCPGDFLAAPYQDAFAKVEQAAAKAGIILGSSAHPGFGIERLLRGGHSFILSNSDVSAIREGFRRDLEALAQVVPK